MNKKLLFIILLIIISGCSYTEISDLTIISTLGIDKINDEYILTATTNSRNKDELKLLNSKDKSLSKSLNKLNIDYSKKIYYNHLNSVIINNNINEHDLNIIINNLSKVSNNFNIYFTNESTNKILNELVDNDINITKDIILPSSTEVYKKINTLNNFHNNYLNNKYYVSININTNTNNNNTVTLIKGNNIIKNTKLYIYHLMTKNIKNFDFEYNDVLINISDIKYKNNKIYGKYHIKDNDTNIKSIDIKNNLNSILNNSYNTLNKYNIKLDKYLFTELKEDLNE